MAVKNGKFITDVLLEQGEKNKNIQTPLRQININIIRTVACTPAQSAMPPKSRIIRIFAL